MQSYIFKFVQTVSVSRDFFLFVHTYSFKTRFNKRYIVQVEEYAHEVFIIKFYLKAHSRSKDKYSKLANDFDGFRVLSTCITIMLAILESKECASFGFLGANAKHEPIANNQRYRIYQHLMQRYFSPAISYMH